ncbi:hypothetical protein O181_001364 [Austropuccinia psidii MF-1]|uniref:Uncharacterized protein n=1 Tax=Austropuccinia psidii MF-1 TaxID=1389203 RepID=A0A9Q3GBT0_9BASI|nr:hypothetical protein [Austropuccinia psidii MF-1]
MWMAYRTIPPHFEIKGGLFSNQKRFPHPFLKFLHSTTIRNSYTLGKQVRYTSTLIIVVLIIVTQLSQGSTLVLPAEPESIKGKRKRHVEILITEKKWIPIASQRSRKPQNAASIQDKPTLITCTGKISTVKPVVKSVCKFPKAVDNKFVQGTVKDTEGDHTHYAIHGPIQQKPQTRGLEGYGSSSSAPPTSQRPFRVEHGQQEFQPNITLGRTWSKLPEDMSQQDILQRPYGNHQIMESQQAVQTPGAEGNQDKGESGYYPSCRRTAEPDRAYSYSFTLRRSRPTQLSSGFTPFRHQKISGQESLFFTIPVGPKDPEAVGLGERSTQEPEIVVNTSRISSPINRNITPTQNEHSVVTTQSSLNSDALWLQMSQFEEQAQKQFAELQDSHEGIKTLTSSMDKMFKTLQEGHAKLRTDSQENNKRLNEVFEEQHHFKRDSDCLDQHLSKFFNVYQNMKPQPQGHILDNPYHQEDIKPDALLYNKTKSQSQYQDGNNMSYSENEALKQLPQASRWPKFPSVAEYDHMEPIDYIDGLFIDVPRIQDYWITAGLNTAFKGNASIWYMEKKEIHSRIKWPWWKRQIIQKYRNDTWIW